MSTKKFHLLSDQLVSVKVISMTTDNLDTDEIVKVPIPFQRLRTLRHYPIRLVPTATEH